jgi:hypothetical protein
VIFDAFRKALSVSLVVLFFFAAAAAPAIYALSCPRLL